MNIEIHPIVSDFKKEVRQRGIKYSQLATLTGISESKLKKIFSGRIEMTLSEYDSIRTALDIGRTLTCVWQSIPWCKLFSACRNN